MTDSSPNDAELAPGPESEPGQQTRLGTDRMMARLSGRNTFLALQLAINLCSALIGLGVYLLLVNAWQIIPLIAAVLGLGCALLARKGLATALVAVLLLRVRQRAREQGDLPPP